MYRAPQHAFTYRKAVLRVGDIAADLWEHLITLTY